jgi:hypothetical protein
MEFTGSRNAAGGGQPIPSIGASTLLCVLDEPRWNPTARAGVGILLLVWAVAVHDSNGDDAFTTALAAAGIVVLAMLLIGMIERRPSSKGTSSEPAEE